MSLFTSFGGCVFTVERGPGGDNFSKSQSAQALINLDTRPGGGFALICDPQLVRDRDRRPLLGLLDIRDREQKPLSIF
jgi:hypothetical protein